jgi:hypothetical protein
MSFIRLFTRRLSADRPVAPTGVGRAAKPTTGDRAMRGPPRHGDSLTRIYWSLLDEDDGEAGAADAPTPILLRE